MVQTDEERKAKAKERRNKPEVKARRKEYDLKSEVKAKKKKFELKPETKAKRKARRDRPERKARRNELTQTPEYKDVAKNTRDDKRLKIIQHYSKLLSNTNTPCCNCCGENSHTEFLAVDHITGKKQMDSEPELVKLGYSSKLQSLPLHNWIIRHDFPVGFQILCSNCNMAKGFYGKCPHEMK